MKNTPIFIPVVCYECFELLNLMQKYGTRLAFPAKSYVLHCDDEKKDFHYIADGTVHYVVSNEFGEERIIMVLEAGSFFGLTPTLEKIPTSSTDCITEKDSVLYKLDRITFFQLLDSSPQFSRALIKGLSRGFHALKRQVESLSFSTCKERLSELLFSSADKNTLVDDLWHPIRYQYSQQDMAKIISANRVTVTGIINELCQDGVIRVINRKIQVRAEDPRAKTRI